MHYIHWYFRAHINLFLYFDLILMQFNANFTRFMQLPMQNICMNAIHCFHSPLILNFTDIQYRSHILRMTTIA